MAGFADWPEWSSRLAFSLSAIAGSWVAGRVLSAVVVSRVARWLPDRQPMWVSTAAQEIRARLPRWSALIGAWIAVEFWPLPPDTRELVGQALFVMGAVSVTLAAASVASRVVDTYGAVLMPAMPVSSLTRNIAWGAVAVTGFLVVLNHLGLSITPMLTALGVGGLAVALALQVPLANFFAGLFLTLGGQIRVGDYVRLDSGEEGYILDLGWRSTRLRMLANNLVVVPNAKLADAIVVNHHLPSQDLAVLVGVGIDYSSDLGHVERVVMEVGQEVMNEVKGGVADFEPFVRYHTFGESSIDFNVILRAKEFTDQYLVKHEFVKRLHRRFDEEGIVIPFPIRTISRRDAPAGELPEELEARYP